MDWLVDCTPRVVQEEALLRSYYGTEARQHRDDDPAPRQVRGGPAKWWGHFLEMRLGKTPLSFAEFALFNRDHGIKNLVVVSPNSYKEDWAMEARKLGCGVPFEVFETSNANEHAEWVKKSPGGFGIAMNYEAFQHQHGRDFFDLVMRPDTMLVLDESIRMKNPQAMATKHITVSSKDAGVVRLLTGLPITQGPQDLYPQLRVMRAHKERNFYAWRNRYCKMGGFKNRVVVGSQNEQELSEVLQSVSFHAKRLQWADPISASQSVLRSSLAREQQQHYDTMRQEFYALLDGGDEVTASMVVTSLMKLQQITSGFIITPEGETVELLPPEKIPKVQRLIELLELEVDGKVVVPFVYQKSGEVLERVLAKYNPAFIFRDEFMRQRGMSVQSEKARFNNDPACRVMLVQMTSGKYGHDLSGSTGARTEVMAFYENTYSLDDRIQIEARITAAVQDWPVHYLDFVSSSVEERPIKALQRKDDVVTAILGDRGRPAMTF